MSEPVVVGEWRKALLEGHQLSPAAVRLVDNLNASQRVRITELRSGVEVEAKGWVGLVRLDGQDIQIMPKLAGNQLGLVQLIQYTSGVGALSRLPSQRTIAAAPDARFLDLLCLLLCEACEEVLRRGVVSDYVQTDDELDAVRGRILYARQARERFGQVDKVLCDFDDYSSDIAENQLLAFALSVCAPRVVDQVIAAQARRLLEVFDDVCTIGSLNLSLASSSILYDRQNAHYREAHSLAWLILEMFGIDDVLSSGETESFAFLIDMGQLFERFLYRVLQDVMQGHEIEYQRRDASIILNANTGKSYSRIAPDVVLSFASEKGSRRVPIDAKYKLYEDRKIDSGDIYQCFLYAYAYQGAAIDRAPESAIVYPSSTGIESGIRLKVSSEDGLKTAFVNAFGLPIAPILKELFERRENGPVANALGEFIRGLGPKVAA